MKFLLVQADGMPDRPIKELGNRTPLEAANTPHLDKLIKLSKMGIVNHIPKGMKSGSDVGNLSILGYNPEKYFTGRSPIEAESIGINLEPNDICYRCNLVTIKNKNGKEIMEDDSAGHIKNKISKQIPYGLVWEDKDETVVSDFRTKTPVIKINKSKDIEDKP